MIATSNSRIDFLRDNFSNRVIWVMLAFQAGWINAGGFLATQRFVTHITGFATQFGFDLSQLRLQHALGMLSVPVFFLAGAMISGFYVDQPISRGEKPRFHVLFFLISLFLALVSAIGILGGFGAFGQQSDPTSTYILIAFLCLSSGIQNAGTTTASNSFVRTTHLTGITTDLGIGLVRSMTGKNLEDRTIERGRNEVRALLIAAFISGSLIGSVLFLKYGYIGFIIPMIISIMLFVIAKKELRGNA